MNNPSVIKLIKSYLEKELPGMEAQNRMAPKFRYKDKEFNTDRSSAKLSSIFIPLYFVDGKLMTVLTQRKEYKGVHSKQVSFPGGKMDKTDPDLKFTALREACEEVNICEHDIEILGKLSDLYIPPSNFLVTPYVGYLNSKPNLIPQESEVDEIIQVPVANFLDEKTLKSKIIHLANGMDSDSPYFDINGKVVWGATAMILGEFVQILKNIVTNEGQSIQY